MASASLENGVGESDDESEPILAPNRDRFTLFPIRYTEIWSFYKRCLCQFWTVDEVDLGKDCNDWNNELNQAEREFLLQVLAFFAASDGIVGENLVENFACEVQIPEARAFYAYQLFVENIHSEMYSLLIDVYAYGDEVLKRRLFGALHTMPHITRKADWCLRWIHGVDGEQKRSECRTVPFAERLVAFAAVEGIFFSGAFAAIFWVKKRGLLPGLTFSNELIARDEAMHVDFACLLFKHLRRRPSSERIIEIVSSAVDVELHFWEAALPQPLLGMNVHEMCKYVRYVADRLLTALECEKHYGDANPFDFMEGISLEGKTNFFEKRVGEYRTRHRALPEPVRDGADWRRVEFRTDADF